METAILFKLLHVFLAFWMIGGLIGRTVVLGWAARSRDVTLTFSLVQVAGFFERWMVIPGSMAVTLAGIATAWAQGWPILGFLQGAAHNWLLVSVLLILSMFPVIRWVFLPRGKVFESALQCALSLGQVTPELRAAFADPVVRAAHIYELASIGAIVYLMVVKPF